MKCTLLALAVLSVLAQALAAYPAACVDLATQWCNLYHNCPIDKGEKYALYDTDEQHGPDQWRCYSASSLDPTHSHYVNGSSYCTREQQLTQLMGNCANGVETTINPVFMHGDGGYPCIRIPSILQAPSGVLFAFAECRHWIGDGCEPAGHTGVEGGTTDACMKASGDGGKTWGNLTVVLQDASQPSPTMMHNGMLNLQLDHQGNSTQMLGTIKGTSISFSPPTSLAKYLGPANGASVGPGVSLTLSPTNPHAPNRILAIGHKGAYVEDWVWGSDDDGATFFVANSSLLHMDEAQLVELSDGRVMANMRNDHYTSCDCRAVSISEDGGSSWSAPLYDPTLISPVCQATIVSDASRENLFFANPASKSERALGTVRKSTDDGKSWSKGFLINSGAYAYSCLVNIDEDFVGLLWETESNPSDCTGPSCMQYFSRIPKSLL